MKDQVKNNRIYIVFTWCGLLFFCLWGLVNTFYGRIHVDEGFYFVTPYLVFQGAVPYGDFIYTQAPLHSYIYQLLYLFKSQPDYWLSRFFSLCLGFSAIVLGIDIARRYSHWLGAAIAAGLLCFNGFQTYFFSISKLYPLTGFILTLGIWLGLQAGGSLWRTVLASFVIALSACIRISMFPAAGVFLIILLARDGIKSRLFWGGLLITIMTWAVIIGPFYLKYNEQFTYSVLLYNFAKDVHPLWMAIMLRADVMSKLAHEYFLFFLILAALGIVAFYIFGQEYGHSFRKFYTALKKAEWFRLYLWGTIGALTALQAVSKSGVVDEYLTPLFPLAAAVVAIECVTVLRYLNRQQVSGFFFAVFTLGCLLNFAAYGRSALTLMDGKSPIVYLDEVAAYIKQVTQEEDSILSYNNALVIMADRTIVKGYEMHCATYDPRWDDERCQKFRILSLSRIELMLKNQEIKMVIMSENAFIGRFPDFYNPGETQMRDTMLAILEQHYDKVKHFPELGYFNTDVDIYLAKSN
ncbi:ArnT family glycosyltransferase [candidate division CSSED10-310 bacterium]|uniref:ArnT family glycosyltransferase n=1 Tax=candidate division CSSED10-310 bacterium TaxID=2855610 RepID=A0ABV6YY64_UNCC1